MKLGFCTSGRWIFAALVVLSCLANACQAEEICASESEGVSLTIYNQNFGLVKDLRSVDLSKGINYLRFEDVAALIDPTSVSFSSVTAPNSVVVREQNYQFDLMDPNTILSKSTGKNLKFRQYLKSGRIIDLSGVLLNSPARGRGLVIRTDDGIVLNPAGQIELKELPEGLISKPSLLWKLDTTKPGNHKTEIAYQTNGLNWKCDYVAILNKDDTKSDLTSWVTLDNKCGATFKNASLKLMAGDVHRVEPPVRLYGDAMVMEAAAGAAAPAPQFQEKAFAEYHLYTLQGKTNVRDKETKQMSLFNAAAIPVKKLFVYEPTASQFGFMPWNSGDSKKVNVKIEIENSEDNNLGMPMPKGKVRVYKADEDGALQFIGEDLIDHTPRDETIRLYIGNAFDLVGERKRTNYQRVSSHVRIESYEISLRNHKDEPVTITAVEHSWGDWKILDSSNSFKKKDSKTFEFEVKVPARGEVKITYEIKIRT